MKNDENFNPRNYLILQILNMVCTVIVVIGFLSCFPLAIIEATRWYGVGLFLLTCFCIIFGGAFVQKRMRKEFTRCFVLPKAKEKFDFVSYNEKEGIDLESVLKAGILAPGFSFAFKDHVVGKYKNVNFECSTLNVAASNSKNSSSTNQKNTVFYGQWYVFDLNKVNFKGRVVATSKLFFTGRSMIQLGKEDVVDKSVKLENVEFNNSFNIRAQYEQDAFYVLTPQMMEKLLKLKQSYSTPIAFSFVDGKIHLAIFSNKEMFPPIMYSKVSKKKAFELAQKYVDNLILPIETLDLDKKLFLK